MYGGRHLLLVTSGTVSLFLRAIVYNSLLPRTLVSAITEILSMLRDYGDRLQGPIGVKAPARAEWSVGTAWRAVLHGDIDDIKEHLELEDRMR